MSFMDDLREGKLGDVGNMRERYEELKGKAGSSELNETERAELSKLRARFEHE